MTLPFDQRSAVSGSCGFLSFQTRENGLELDPDPLAFKNVRILLAEDDPVCQFVAGEFMTRFGFSVDIAENGREALQLLAQNDYSLVLMDCQMPEMGGLEATAILRDPGSNVRNHWLPVIALTASSLKEEREKCLEHGMDDYLSKPLDFDSLSVVLARWLAKTPAEGSRIFDQAGLLRRHEGNESLAGEIARMFAARAPGYIALLRKCLAEGDHLGFQQQAHKLKGAASTLGADRLAALAAELFELGRMNDLGRAGQSMQQLAEEFACLLTVLAERGFITRG